MKLLEHTIYSNKPKNVDIFPLAEKVKTINFNCLITFSKFRFVVEPMEYELLVVKVLKIVHQWVLH